MMTKLLDYHVGLLRGFLIHPAAAAPPQVLHALDLLLAGYRSQAGEMIGSAGEEPRIIIRPEDLKRVLPEETVKFKEPEPRQVEIKPKQPPVTEMVPHFPGKKYAAIYSKIVALGLTPHVTRGSK